MSAVPWRREARVVGWLPLALPVAVAVGALLSAVTLVAGADAWGEARRLLVAGLESALPLAAGVAAATAVAGDPAVELQLTLGTPYRRTVTRRVALVALGASLAGLAVTGVLLAAGVLPAAAAAPFVLLWAAPLAWFLAAGAVAGLLLGRAAGGALLAAVWLAQLLAGGELAGRAWARWLALFATGQAGRGADWTATRLALVVQAVVLVGVAAALLRRTDQLVAGAQE